jgi:hypothetical protein
MRTFERHWLLLACLAPLLVGGAGEAVTQIRAAERLRATEIHLDIGRQPFNYAGNREALKAVASAMRSYPNAKQITISRTVDRGTSWASGPRWVILQTRYDREKQSLRDSRLGEGTGWWFTGATKTRILAAAAQNCSFEDMRRFGCRDIAD